MNAPALSLHAITNRFVALLRYPVGNHTYSHPHLSQLADTDVDGEIRQGAATRALISGADTHPMFRFPYGESDTRAIAIANRLGYGGVRWTVYTLGWHSSRVNSRSTPSSRA